MSDEESMILKATYYTKAFCSVGCIAALDLENWTTIIDILPSQLSQHAQQERDLAGSLVAALCESESLLPKIWH